MAIRNPVEWGLDLFKFGPSAEDRGGLTDRPVDRRSAAPPVVRRISLSDLRDALARGWQDFGAYRTDVIFLCLFYPAAGLVLSRLAFGYDLLPMIFPLASGFALIGPFAAIGLYQMSLQRERGAVPSWADAFAVVRSPALGAILALGLTLLAIFVLWLIAAEIIYGVTLGPEPPVSAAAFAHDALQTRAGWLMIGLGIGVGFVFALVSFVISVVSFPLLLDRRVGIGQAITTSVRAVRLNPLPMAAWGLIVAGGLIAGSLPLLIGLVIVMPVLGHATWHLYRKIVAV